MTCWSLKGQSRALSLIYITHSPLLFCAAFATSSTIEFVVQRKQEAPLPTIVHVLKPPFSGHSKITFLLSHLSQLWQQCLQTLVSFPMKNWPDLALVCKMGSACTHPSDSKDAEFSVNEAEPGATNLVVVKVSFNQQLSRILQIFGDILFICLYVFIFLHFISRRDAREIRLV